MNFIRIEKPRRPSQLSECYGAGTGCGWCRKYLERLLLEAQPSQKENLAEENAPSNEACFDHLSLEEYAKQRSQYVRDGGGTPPPGATPIEE